tara:strand:- start:9 stop:962 length:954 start_codon:yes stop_codon:yes gene_type:complete
MKNLKKSLIALIAAFAVSCGDPDLPVELFPTMEYGAYARKMSQSGTYNYYEVGSSQVDLSVEYYDANDGANIASYAIEVEYVDNKTGGAKSKPRTAMRTINASEFGTNADGFLSSDISLSFNDAMSTLGITLADVDGGAYFRYWFTITMNDGRTFGYDNTGPNMMSSSAFAALFRLNVYIVCPSSLEGAVVANSTQVGAWSSAWTDPLTGVTDEIVMVGSADNIYTMKDDNALGAWGPNGANYSIPAASGPELTDACNVLSYSGSDDYSEEWSLVAGSVSVSTDNKTLSYTWENTYGESAAVEMTYADGSSWPALTN